MFLKKKKKCILLGRFIRLTMSGKTSDILGKFFAFKSTPKTVLTDTHSTPLTFHKYFPKNNIIFVHSGYQDCDKTIDKQGKR